MWQTNGSMVITRWDKRFRQKVDGWSKHCVRGRKFWYPVAQIDDYVKHIFREHNQEADHLANLGTEGQKEVTIEGVKNTEDWKAVRGY